jgi:hypothetical protein
LRIRSTGSVIGRLTAAVVVVGMVLCAGLVTERLGKYARFYANKSRQYRILEMDLIRDQARWEAMECEEREAAAMFRRGEWGGADDVYKQEFESIIKAFEDAHPGSYANDLRKKHYASRAGSCDERADSMHEVAMSLARKAAHFARLKQKYKQAERTPWVTVPTDPAEPE